MRTIVDIPETDIVPLDALAREQRVSRAALIREAVTLLISKHSQSLSKKRLRQHPAFGAWHTDGNDGKAQDSVDIQRRLRAEWS